MNDFPWRNLALAGVACAAVSACASAPERIRDDPATRVIPRMDPEAAGVPEGNPKLGPRVDLGGARMQIPKGWVPTSGGSLQWENAGGGDDRRPSAANMNVIVGDPKRLDITWEAFWQDLSDQYRARTEGIQEIVEEGRIEVGHRPAYRFAIERREGGIRFGLVQYIIGTDRFVYYVTFAARIDEFSRYEPLFRQCVATFIEK